ncbi:hypothetical protein [Methylobacterium frigidaeris]|uniref:Uncharacterized protein n=1 Tax=Methylobacterium frigidaeris TaxID=2038277 RepID=A0AA37HD11_9HYPH|nr:hypothetical protein [Methylobacterium frigidaeris]GJD63738.1 hypothetical protein MPEAHAMD_3909 [Methylobacterium frigidaeris]
MPFLTQNAAGEPIVIPIGGQPGLTGGRGEEGRSAYEIAVEVGGYAGSEADFAAMLANAGSAETTVTLVAATDMPGGIFAAAVGSGQARATAPADPASAAGVAIGYLDGAAAAGSVVTLRKSGRVRVSGAAWTAGDSIFLTDYGAPTSTPRTSGWAQQVGVGTGPDTFDLAIDIAEVITPLITLDAIGSVLLQALTDVVASYAIEPPDQPGVLWRNQTLVALSPNSDGSPYTAPYDTGAADPIAALLPVIVPRVLRSLPRDPPTLAGVLWLNNGRPALAPNADGTPYPARPLPTSGSPLLRATRSALALWLAATVPGLPVLLPVSSGALWRSTNLLAVS